MKIKTFVLLALLGHTSAQEAAAAGTTEETKEPEIPWYWSAEKAIESETKELTENPLYDESPDGGILMAACFGLQSCAGFKGTDSAEVELTEEQKFVYAARDFNCNVGRTQTATGRKDATSALTLTDFETLCPNLKPVSTQPRPYDAMPVTFNYPVLQKVKDAEGKEIESLNINGDNFIITLSDGTFTRPVCALLDPANEGNEQHTVALIGHFGGRDEGQWPTQIRVVGDLKLRKIDTEETIKAAGLKLDFASGGTEWSMGLKQYGYGMAYNSGLVMLKAWMYPFSDKGETAENHCKIDFPSTTHVIKIMFNGGISVDGIHPLVPSDTRIFTIFKPRGQTVLWNKFKGLADLGTDKMWTEWPQLYQTDGDNYVDLCLELNPDEDGKDIQSVQIQPNSVFPPRGTGPNIQHMVKVDHIDKDGVYPYDLPMVKFADKLFEIYVAKVFEILGIAGTAGSGIVLVPLLGFGLGAGLMFLQSFVKLDIDWNI